MRLDTLHDLLVNQLQDLYCTEQQIYDVLPELAKTAYSYDLKKTFEQHFNSTKNQIIRLKKIFRKLELNYNHHRCEGIEGLINECIRIVRLEGNPAIKDAALINVVQKIEHYELDSYNSVRTYARELGYKYIADLLQESVDEENETDKQLVSLTKGGFYSRSIDEENY
ncbi:MAG: DUF892 family protein [Fibrobacter sp.]|nr:DUF892 family protein [Fibrobacter sp.]